MVPKCAYTQLDVIYKIWILVGIPRCIHTNVYILHTFVDDLANNFEFLNVGSLDNGVRKLQ